MQTYPYTPSQIDGSTAQDWLAFLNAPTMVARRFAEIVDAQQFIGNYLLSARYAMTGGMIAVPANEKIRTDRKASTVAPGGEYKLTTLSAEEYEIYNSMIEGLATEVTDAEVTRSRRQPIDDAFTFLQTELVFDANEIALGVIESSVTRTFASKAAWTNGKEILRAAYAAKALTRKQKLGYSIDTAVIPGEQYAEIMPELLDVLPKDSALALGDTFPTIGGITWIPEDGDDLTAPLFLDRRRFGGIAREQIASPEYRQIGGDTGVEIASVRNIALGDKTRLQARNVHVPVITNPLAAVYVTGTEAP
ncbi:hypothetical protein [Microbacterium sp. 16-032]|uniref:hypothetical protein n=1 Tax=Microbacterium sp. 16-032 TaxID=3239808 RepID=UPI0034E25CE6